MISFNVPLKEIQILLLIFLRVGAIVLTAPIFRSPNIPMTFRIGLVLMVSILLFPVLETDRFPFITGIFPFGIGIISEILLGSAIGLSIQILFVGIQMAGQLVGFQMGISISEVLDPESGEEMSILGQLKYFIALMIFLAINAHHIIFKALVESFKIVPPFDFHMGSAFFDHLVRISGEMFLISIQVGAPIIVTLLLTSVAFGLLARTVPQMNIFIVAMPLKIIIGLFFFGICVPYFVSFFRQIFTELGNNIIIMLKTM